MADTAAVPMLILARTEDFVSVINSTLRNAGLAVHCLWSRDTKAMADTLSTATVEMILAFIGSEPDEATSVVQIRNRSAAAVPIVFVRERIDEEIIAAAMQMGARDVVTLGSKARLQAVVAREIRAYRLERELATYKTAAKQSHEQVKAIIADTADAIAFIQEGILVEANQAWCSAFGFSQQEQIVGHPFMDLLDSRAQSAFKPALSACLQNKWAGQSLTATVIKPSGGEVQLEFRLARGDYDGEPAVRISLVNKQDDANSSLVSAPPAVQPVALPPGTSQAITQAITQPITPAITQTITQPPPPTANASPPSAPAMAVPVIATVVNTHGEASQRDASTQFWQRKPFMEQLAVKLETLPKGQTRVLAMLAPDKFGELEEQFGPLHLEEFMAQFAAIVRDCFASTDLIGRYNDGTIAVLLERPIIANIETVLTHAMARAAAKVLQVGGKSIMYTLSAGLCILDVNKRDLNMPISDALRALHEAQAQGGNRQQIIDRTDEDTKQQANDAIWVQMIKSALMDNRFKLMQQPIASLMGEERGMFDVLVRMIDEQNQEILPHEFMSAALRNDLMKNIDRWVIGSAIAFATSRQVQRLFVRISRDSVRDKSLAPWLTLQIKSSRLDPALIAFQVDEPIAVEFLADTASLSATLRQLGFKFAIEHFGSGRDSARLLSHVGLDFVKIDGGLMKNLAVDSDLQQRVKALVEAAHNRKAHTIAERVEDANTMAVLWQLGIGYVQGYFINEPEQVVMG